LKGFEGTEQQKIALGGTVFHAEYDTQPIVLNAFGEKMTNLHGIVIGDADTVQSTRSGSCDGILNHQLAAGRKGCVDMKVE
jgi:hypothetical protein